MHAIKRSNVAVALRALRIRINCVCMYVCSVWRLALRRIQYNFFSPLGARFE